jgi:signal transduction histidine kinase
LQPLLGRLRNVALWLGCALAGLLVAQLSFNGRWPVADVLAQAVSAWNNQLLTHTQGARDHPVRLVNLGPAPSDPAQIIELLDLLNYARSKAVLLYVDVGRLTRDDAAREAALAAAVRRYASVVLVEGPSEGVGDWRLPPAVRSAAASVGHRQYHSAANGSVQGILVGAVPGLPEDHALVALARLVNARAPEPTPPRAAPADSSRTAWDIQLLPYGSPPGAFAAIAAAELRPGAPELRNLRGKVVVIGSIEESPVPTPYDTLAARGEPVRRMSELEVGANYAAALLTGRVVQPVSASHSRAIVVLTVLVCCLPLLLWSPLAGYVATLALGAATLPAWWLAAQEHLLAYGDAPLAATAVFVTGLLWIAASLWRSRRSAQRLLEQLSSVRLPMRLADLAPAASASRDSSELAQVAINTARANQALTAAVIDSLPIAVLLIDSDARVLATNRRAEQWFGSDNPVGRQAQALLRSFEFYGAADASLLLSARSHRAEARCQSQDVVLDARLLEVEGQRPVRLVGIQDVSQVKQAVNDRVDAVDFLTHDLRTPLHGILVLTGQLEREGPGAGLLPGTAPAVEQATTMRQIRAMTERTIRLADNYVHLLRTDGATASAFTEVSLNDVIEEALATAHPLASQRGVSLRDTVGLMCFVRGDYALLFRALVNILGNAIRHAPGGSCVHLALELEDEAVTVCVRDEGAGFPSELIGRAVDRYRVGKRPKANGVGLGLALVEAVARKHGGRMLLVNREQGGAEARFTMPLLEVAAQPALRLA